MARFWTAPAREENDDNHYDGQATEHQRLDIPWQYPRWREPLVGYTWNLILFVCHWLFMPHKEKSVLADRQISAIDHFFGDKEAVFVFKIHQIRFSVPNLIERGSLLRVALDVCKLRVVVDGLDVKRLLIGLEAVGEANLGKELAELAVQRSLSGFFGAESFFLGELDLLAVVVDLARRDETRRLLRFANHGLFFGLDKHLEIRVGIRKLRYLHQNERIDVAGCGNEI